MARGALVLLVWTWVGEALFGAQYARARWAELLQSAAPLLECGAREVCTRDALHAACCEVSGGILADKIGSGKTAMDAIVHLSRREGGMASRLHCVAGRGTYFMNRDLCFPTDR